MDYCSMLIILMSTSQLVNAASKYYEGDNRPYEFGFNIEGNQHRHESKDANGIIMGEFGFITADGVYHVTAYATDENGNFKILFMKNIKIGLPGNQTKNALGLPTKPQRPATMRIDLVAKTPSSKGVELGKIGPADTRACSGCAIPQDKLATKSMQPAGRLGKQLDITKMRENTYNLMDINMPNRIHTVDRFSTSDQGSTSPPALNNDSVDRGRSGTNSAQQKPQTIADFIGNSLGKARSDETNSPIERSNNANLNGPQGIILGGDQANFTSNPQSGEKSYKAPNAIGKSVGKAGALEPNRASFDARKPSNQAGNQLGDAGNPQINDGIPNNRKAADQAGRQAANDNRAGKSPNYPIDRETLEEMRKALVGILYKFNYTAGYHGHHEQGDRAGAKDGGYFFTGRDSLQRNVEYVANDFGYQPYITQEQVGDDQTPKEATEKEAGLKGYEFKWFSERE